MSDPNPVDQKKSKGQKKKEKLKAKKVDEEKKEEESADVGEEEKVEQDSAKATKGKKKAAKGPVNLAAKLAQERMQKLKEEEEERKRQEEEERRLEEEIRLREEEEERKRKEEEEAKKKEKQERLEKLKKDGLFLSKKDREKRERMLAEGIIEEFNQDEAEELIRQAKEKKRNKKKPKKEESILDNPNLILEKKETEENTKEDNPELKEKAVNWEDNLDPSHVEKEEKLISKENEPKQDSQDSQKTKKKNENSTIEESKIAENLKRFQEYDSKATGKDIVPVSDFRSAICCIMGHVDTGKTTLLDKIRNTNVQEGEAGGITQQIGATYFPPEKLELEANKIKGFYPLENILPGLMIIDTPGHESFANLRNRGSSLCDIGILVIDLMHGLENQTIESIQMLRSRKTPFVIALNKIDRLFEWKTVPMRSSYEALKAQGSFQWNEFNNKSKPILTQLAELELNTALYWENPDPRSFINIVPTSGVTGEGIPDLLGVIMTMCSKYMKKQLKVEPNIFACTVLEVKLIEGLGMTIDCILVQGEISEGDTIILEGFDGPITTTVRALLTPHPMQEMRVKGEYVHHKKIKGAIGIKISANKLENAVAGSPLFVLKDPEMAEEYKLELEKEMDSVKKKVKLHKSGVCVAASTLGSLEALLEFLKTCKIPVSSIVIGPVHRDDVMKAIKPLLNEDEKKIKKEHAVVLAFDVKIHPDAQELADSYKIKIFTAKIIYHLFDQFTNYLKELKLGFLNQRRNEKENDEGSCFSLHIKGASVYLACRIFQQERPYCYGSGY